MSKLDRLVEARMALKARFEAEMSKTPSVADEQPQGTGPSNRHGMPKLPVGQVVSKKWPVLDLGVHPEVPLARWRLVVDGACHSPLTLSYEEFSALPQVEDTSDFHCVTPCSRGSPQPGTSLGQLPSPGRAGSATSEKSRPGWRS